MDSAFLAVTNFPHQSRSTERRSASGRQKHRGFDSAAIGRHFLHWAKAKWRNDLPPAWRESLWSFPDHLEAISVPSSGITKILISALRLLEILGKFPQEVTKNDLLLAGAKSKPSNGAETHICMFMARRGLWPKAFLRQRAEVRTIRRYLSPSWQSFLQEFKRYLVGQNVPGSTRHYFMRMATFFLWWRELPDKGSIDADILQQAWMELWSDAPDGLQTEYPRLAANRDRCFAAIWNVLLEGRRVSGEPREFVQAAASFWKTIREPVRAAAYRLLGSRDSGARRHLALYALTLLGFSRFGPARPLEVSEAEWTRLRRTLSDERFSESAIRGTEADCKTLLELVRHPCLDSGGTL